MTWLPAPVEEVTRTVRTGTATPWIGRDHRTGRPAGTRATYVQQLPVCRPPVSCKTYDPITCMALSRCSGGALPQLADESHSPCTAKRIESSRSLPSVAFAALNTAGQTKAHRRKGKAKQKYVVHAKQKNKGARQAAADSGHSLPQSPQSHCSGAGGLGSQRAKQGLFGGGLCVCAVAMCPCGGLLLAASRVDGRRRRARRSSGGHVPVDG